MSSRRSKDAWFIDVISGRKRGMASALLRSGLSFVEPVYAVASSARNLLFDVGLKKSHQCGVPVISIGNVTTGGTGKTPTVAWVVNQLKNVDFRPGILSRGYRSLDGTGNDEKRLLDQLCPGTPHIQDRNRVTGAASLIGETNCNSIVLDDGFQHRRLHRDLDIVLVDALNPWGFGHLLPRGLLRESLKAMQRADCIVVTRGRQATAEQLNSIIETAKQYNADCPLLISSFEPTGLVNASGKQQSFEKLNGKRTCSFAGIGNPAGFRRTLASLGLAVSDDRFNAFPDHHHYDESDLTKIRQWAIDQHAEALVVTRKDLVKLNVDHIGSIPLWAVNIELEFLDDPAPLIEQLRHVASNARQ